MATLKFEFTKDFFSRLIIFKNVWIKVKRTFGIGTTTAWWSVWPDGEISSPIFYKSCPKSIHTDWCKKFHFSQCPKIVAKYLGFFCKKLCSQELSKIAQSGHTDDDEWFFGINQLKWVRMENLFSIHSRSFVRFFLLFSLFCGSKIFQVSVVIECCQSMLEFMS